MIKNLLEKFRNQDIKTKIVTTNIIWSAATKVISIGSSFLSVPLLLAYLNPTEYGIWLTMGAFLGWFGVFDLGIGNGLRNKLTEALTVKDIESANIYVSTAYAALSIIFTALFFIFFGISYFVNWSIIFNASPSLGGALLTAIIILFAALCSQFVLKLISTIIIAHHKIAWADALNTLIQVVLLLIIWQLQETPTNYHKLVVISAVYAIVPIAILIPVNLVLFKHNYAYLRPSLSLVKLSHFKSIGSLGSSFFLIQLAAIVIYATDNMIISHLFSPEQVTIYNIAFKYFSILTMAFSIILAPFLSMITTAYKENDIDWIKASMKKVVLLWGLLTIGCFTFLVLSPIFYNYWVGKTIHVPFVLSFVLTFYVIGFNLGVAFVTFINAIGKIKLQLYLSCICVFMNITLIFLYCKVFNIGIIGVPLATLTTIFASVIMNYIQYQKIINKRAFGIWND